MSQTYAANALPVGTMIQEYRIVAVLGAGSFGIVYKAENVYLDEVVAIKEFLPSDLACRTEGTRVVPLSSATEEPYGWALRQFLKEAQILWDLARPARHPNIIRVSRFHEDNGTAYMVMDFEEGQSLSQVLDERGTLTEAELRTILDPLLDGLERVHAASVWHRDIKPGNILIRSDGSPVLIDFGAARQDRGDRARSVMAMFSPAYAAPEQVMAMGEQGPWTDIYSLAATLYRAVTGRTPTGVSERALGVGHVPAIEAASGNYSASLLLAIDQALALQPGERPQSVAAWRQMFHLGATAAAGQKVDATVLRPLARPPAAGAPPTTAADLAPDAILPPAQAYSAGAQGRAGGTPPRRRTGRLLAAVLAIAAIVAGGYAVVRFEPWTGFVDRTTKPPTASTDVGRTTPPRETTTVGPGPAVTQPPATVKPPTPPTSAVVVDVSPRHEPPVVPATPTTTTVTAVTTSPVVTPPVQPPTPPVTPPIATAIVQPPEPPKLPPATTTAAQPPTTTARLTPPASPAIDYQAVSDAVSRIVAEFGCADLSATLSSDTKVYVEGRVSSSRDLRALESRLGGIEHVKGVVPRVQILERPFCDVMDLLGPFGLSARAARKGPAIAVNSPTLSFREGELLVVEVTAGREDRGYLYVDYMDSAGSFVHMLPSPSQQTNAVAPGQRVVVGSTSPGAPGGAQQYEIAPPHGRGMIVAMVSRRPLFNGPRPEVESADDYLAALDAALARLQAEDRAGEMAASSLFFETHP
jgi:hypothetical protein